MTQATVRSPRVLVAEDNAVNQRVLRGMLALCGLEAEFVRTGHEAVAAWRAGHH